MATYHTGSDPIEIGDLGSKVKVKVTVTQYPFFHYNSLLTSLTVYLSCLNKMKFSMPLGYALCRFVVEFHENQMGNDVMVTSFILSPYKYPYFKLY